MTDTDRLAAQPVKQSRRMSVAEAVFNTASGYVVAVVAGFLIYPLWGWSVTATENLQVGALFSVASVLRGYVVRRFFECIRAAGGIGAIIRKIIAGIRRFLQGRKKD